MDNLWAIKCVLKWFEISSELKVNFAKSHLIIVNVADSSIDLATRFLHGRSAF